MKAFALQKILNSNHTYGSERDRRMIIDVLGSGRYDADLSQVILDIADVTITINAENWLVDYMKATGLTIIDSKDKHRRDVFIFNRNLFDQQRGDIKLKDYLENGRFTPKVADKLFDVIEHKLAESSSLVFDIEQSISREDTESIVLLTRYIILHSNILDIRSPDGLIFKSRIIPTMCQMYFSYLSPDIYWDNLLEKLRVNEKVHIVQPTGAFKTDYIVTEKQARSIELVHEETGEEITISKYEATERIVYLVPDLFFEQRLYLEDFPREKVDFKYPINNSLDYQKSRYHTDKAVTVPESKIVYYDEFKNMEYEDFRRVYGVEPPQIDFFSLARGEESPYKNILKYVNEKRIEMGLPEYVPGQQKGNLIEGEDAHE